MQQKQLQASCDPMFKCPYCEFNGKRSEVHSHLAESHPDTLGSRVDEFTGHTFYIVTCPICGASYEQVTKKARRDPGFISEYEYEIHLVVFDLLLYHLQGEHGFGTSRLGSVPSQPKGTGE